VNADTGRVEGGLNRTIIVEEERFITDHKKDVGLHIAAVIGIQVGAGPHRFAMHEAAEHQS